MENLVKRVNISIKRLEETKVDLEKKLMENFEYGFKFYSEELYKTCYKLRQYKNLIGSLLNDEEDGTEKVKEIIEYYQSQVNSWSVARSTCPLSVQQSIYELEAMKEMIEYFKWLM